MLAPECNYLHTNNYINTIADILEKSTGILVLLVRILTVAGLKV
jgi:hypothetical protein